MNQEQTTFNGVGIPTAFAQGPVLVTAGSLEILKSYLGHGADYSQACQVAITVGPYADPNAINLPSMAGLMAARKFVSSLGQVQIGEEISNAEIKNAKDQGLVVVYGYSDDNAEFRGAMTGEASCYDGGHIDFNARGKFFSEDILEDIENLFLEGFIDKIPEVNRITAVWCAKDCPAWTYVTDIPHATFDVMEEGEVWCRGIVFHISDLK